MSIESPADSFELLLHVAADPMRLLGGKSLPLFDALWFGYRAGLPEGSSFAELSAPGFEQFIRGQFPIPERWPDHLSAKCYVRFLGPDDASAFDNYVILQRDYFAAHPPDRPQPLISDGSGLDKLLESIRPRPRMYFGNEPDLIACLVALLNGAIEAEILHTHSSPTATLMGNFQAWLDARYPWALGRPWHRILAFQNLWDPERTLTAFWTHFDLFRNGEPPDALTPTGKHLFETNPGLENMSQAEREAWMQKLNRIFFTS